jgi:hypothetical protein
LWIHLLSFKIETQGMTTIRELADARGVERVNKATVKGLVELSGMDRENSAGRQERLAIVVADPLIHKMATLYGQAIKTADHDVSVFEDVDEALSWLGYTAPEVVQLRRFIKKHRAAAG